MSAGEPFPLRDYTLTHRATGLRALNRRELREAVRTAPPDSLFLHFWGRLLRPGWRPGEYGNDLANWAATGLHDLVLAERLALIDPRRHPEPDLVGLRRRVLEVLEERLEEPGAPPAEAPESEAFHFLVAHVVLYDTGTALRHPGELPQRLGELSPTMLLHHFVDAPGSPVHAGAELRRWLLEWDGPARSFAGQLEAVDLFLHDEEELRARLVELAESTLGSAAGNGDGGST